MTKRSAAKLPIAIVLGLALLGLAASPTTAQDRHNNSMHGPVWNHPPVHRGPAMHVPRDRVRHYRSIAIVRPHGHWYHGYGRFHADNDAYAWLAFTAITLQAFDVLSEAQERAHETAQIQATTAPIGDSIVWNQGSASGSVTALRDGTSTNGRYCREFQQTVKIGNKTENAYGTACQQADGAWEIVSTGS